MTLLTPGIAHISRLLIVLTTPYVLITLFDHFVLQPHNIGQENWVLLTASVFFLPILLSLHVVYDQMKVRSRARTLGARPVPVAEGSMIMSWLGNVDLLMKVARENRKGYPGDGFWDLMDKYGPIFNLRFLWGDNMLTTNPDHIQRVLASNFNNHVKGSNFQFNMRSVLGVGVFNSDGDMWKFHRSMTRPFFNRDRITHFELFDRHAEVTMKRMKDRLREGYPVDFQDLMGRFTLDSATEFLFGSCFHSLNGVLPYPHNADPVLLQQSSTSTVSEADAFASAFLKAQQVIAEREDFGRMAWPFFEVFEDRTEEPMRVLNGIIGRYVEETLRKKGKSQKGELGEEEKGDEGGDDGKSLLDELVKMTDDPKVIKDEVLNILIAGRDTTAETLTFIVYLLSTHPKIFAKLREEILSTLGKDTRRGFTFEEMKECRYLRAMINETLRLFPIVPFNVREAITEETLPSPDPNLPPVYIPAGTRWVIAYSVFMMHRRKDLWGPDAEVFDPDRFLDERFKKYLAPKPFIFLPFNAGPRICLGQQFAYNEMSLMIIRLVQNFSSFSFDPEACPPDCRAPPEWAALKDGSRKSVDGIRPKMALTMNILGGMWVRAVESVEEA
ncbi:cytochrome P450 [Dendrothele bispora CBS 962.96]|uniref:Cytochrome P450 n=1 Tax=Dendrothele bispora (strain CBS 962.96) TaxID=1314807 RepID=A0A4S8KP16_DENBC|nr:cytochrome P450 [Dendrothele bispora CBS 962.96]